MVLAVLNVFFRDVGQFFNILIQFWFWMTPIVYPVTILPERIRSLLQLNPMASVIAAYQNVLVSREWPVWSSLALPMAAGILLCLLGLHLFRKHVGEIVDEL
jgi:lipopolysaccharide transport system permease protein